MLHCDFDISIQLPTYYTSPFEYYTKNKIQENKKKHKYRYLPKPRPETNSNGMAGGNIKREQSY